MLSCPTELEDSTSVQNMTLISTEDTEPIMCTSSIRGAFPQIMMLIFFMLKALLKIPH